ncbi:FAD-dependent oxidoreductase [Ktedonobacter racemifer]|uniref:FAD dependent oxidoreductase n=1 Tax=Ktedonobacter racemifer DSM 44963 TaxID=485913 RepID=D6U0B3_KTERA|nr:NAD(P)/FAD-dependent oxidoreductase [Ktedonobacter racemifer]EFH82253.1 FAD dependent oxidoreductase [Ktedonobacter racemifer DSM 44963]
MKKHPLHVVIIGAGIGGLCLAQKLKQAGINVAVYERDRSRTARLQGYRIHINPAGSSALHECLPARLYEIFLATCGQSGSGFNFLTEQAKELLFLETQEEGTIPDPVDSHKSVSRFTLRQVLLTGLEDIVHFDKPFERYEELPDGGVTVHFEDGTSATCDVLIGGDGANSRVRKQFLPSAQRVNTGYGAIQGKAILSDELRHALPSRLFRGPASVLAPKGFSMFIAVQQFQHKPGEIEEISDAIRLHPDLLLSDTQDFVSWGLIARQVKFPLHRDPQALDGTELKQVICDVLQEQNWHSAFQKLVRESDATTVIFTRISSSVPVAPWQTKRVTLLGDAIHSMTPARGIGANTALRDASLLGRKLVATSRGELSLEQAMHDYEAEMLVYGFDAVRSSLKALEQGAALEKPLPLALAKTTFRVMNAVPALKRQAFKGFGDN